MSACFSITILSVLVPEKHEIVFFEAGQWTIESEKELIVRVQELLGTIRPLGQSINLNLTLQVTDINSTMFLINKKIKNIVNINNQKLSIREIEVLALIMQGLTNNEIAGRLFISYETVKSHRKNILEKTGAKNTAALINYYHQTFFEK